MAILQSTQIDGNLTVSGDIIITDDNDIEIEDEELISLMESLGGGE